jgi:hypothetical protein
VALPTLTWRAFTPVTLSANTTVAILDAIYTNGTATVNYADGTPRPAPGTVGSTSWTWNRESPAGVTVSAYGSPPQPAGPDAMIPTTYIVAGASALPGSGPTMATINGLTPDANAINRLNLGMVKNPGAYTNWNAANPFTSGNFSGYATVSPATTVITYVTLYMWECQEAWIAMLFNAGGTQGYFMGGGAFVNPLSTASLNAESDGRCYSVNTTGATQFVANTWISNISGSVGPFRGGTGANGSRWYQFAPGTGTLRSLVRMTAGTAAALSSTSTTPNGEFPFVPMFDMLDTTSSQYMGELRQIGATRAARVGQRWSNGGTIVAYILSAQTGTDREAAAMLY